MECPSLSECTTHSVKSFSRACGKPQNDTISFECGDSTTRENPTTVLSVGSPYSANVLRDVIPGETVEVEFLVEIMDLIIEHTKADKTLTVQKDKTVSPRSVRIRRGAAKFLRLDVL